MAEASISVAQDQFVCPVCLELLKDPVTVPCGHSYCKVCINCCWDQEDQRQVYSCPQCRETFTPRPVLCRNNMLAVVMEKLKTDLQTAFAAHCYPQDADVECDFCTGTKFQAVKSCLTCLASYCENHIKPHYQSPAFKKHHLVDASSKLQGKICSQHDRMMEVYCRTDESCICYLCTMHEHRGHDTVAAVAERSDKQRVLKDIQKECDQRLQEKQRKVKEVKKTVENIKAALEDSERVFTELNSCIEKKPSEVTELIRYQEGAELSRAEGHLEQLMKEIADLKRRDNELQQLSHTEDHIHFLQSFQSLSVSSGFEDSSSFVHCRSSLDDVRKSLSGLKDRLEVSKIPPYAGATQMILSSAPQTREDFLKYFSHLTLDPDTAQHTLILSEEKRVVTNSVISQHYSCHPERFNCWPQVLCKESVCEQCYWEIEWSGKRGVSISVSYKEMSRKGWGHECLFGYNNQSWRLHCSSSLSFCHNRIRTEISASPCSRIGVYVDHSAGTLSFYKVSDTMILLHRVHTTFTQPLYAGFIIYNESIVRLCCPK